MAEFQPGPELGASLVTAMLNIDIICMMLKNFVFVYLCCIFVFSITLIGDFVTLPLYCH
jgi:hypothetical protein